MFASSRQRAKRALFAFFASLLLGAAFLPAPQARAVAFANAAATSVNGQTIQCDQSPFGHVLHLGQENEVSVSYQNTEAGTPGSLASLRLDQNPADNRLKAQEFVQDNNSSRSSISNLVSTAADLDGNGNAEFVQAFTDANGQYQIAVDRNVNGSTTIQSHVENWTNDTARAIAAGDVLGLDDGSQQVVIASRASDGGLRVAVFTNNATTGVGGPVAFWRSNINNRSQASQIQVAVGNLDDDGYADIIVSLLQSDGKTAQIIYLEYQPGYQGGTGINAAKNLQERSSATRSLGFTPKKLRLTLANLTGSPEDRVVLAWDQAGYLGGLSPSIYLADFGYLPATGFAFRDQLTVPSNSLNFALAAGDVLGEHHDQLVLEYDIEGNSQAGSLNVDLINLTNANTANPALASVAHWQDSQDYRNMTDDLAVAVGDFNKDNRAEIVSAFKDANALGFQTLYLSAQINANGAPPSLALRDWGRQDATLTAPPSIAIGDWDNDSLLAYVRGTCARVVDGDVTGVGFIPPFWQNIQVQQQMGGSFGRSVTQEGSVEQSLTYRRGETVSAYVGVSAGVSIFDLAEFSASARTTGAQEYATSNKRTTSTGTSTVTTVGQSWGNDALVYEPAEYNCYSYQLSQHGAFISTDKARLRFCEYQALPGSLPSLKASELNSWDANFRSQPEYVPALRDWTSLALFRGAYATQSSNPAGARFALNDEIANGSFVTGTMAQTASQNNPWWQVDLGSTQPIGKIRLWTPPTSLSNFYVFVSNTDFRAIPGQENPATLLNAPGVRHYSLADLGNGFKTTDIAPSTTTFITLDDQNQPIQGRYVRVQRVGASTLTLAEVQVFGANHVEPDRYPLDMRDTTPGDHVFEVKLYNPYHTTDSDTYVWVKTRGDLLWDGRTNPPLNGLSVDRGNGIVDWSLSKDATTTNVEATEIENTTSVGAEFEVEGGIGVKVQTGTGLERTSSVASEIVQSTSWGTGFNMGGQMQGFPAGYDGPKNAWVLQCRYRFQPYYYELTETSNLGYQQRFPVLDYLVPSEGRSDDLNRAVDLSACRNGNLTSQTPQANSDTAQAIANQPVTLNVLANDMGDDLTITGIGTPLHGTATFAARTITYTPRPGFSGTDSFTYSVASGTGDSTTGTVTIVVGAGGGTTTLYVPIAQRR